MNRTQKAAVYGLYIAGFLLLVPLIDLVDNMLNPVLLRVICYPLAVLMVVPVFFLTRKRGQTRAVIDERDKAIAKRAILFALISVGVLALAIYLIALFAVEPKGHIEVSWLPVVVYYLFITFLVLVSFAVLVQYGRGGGDA